MFCLVLAQQLDLILHAPPDELLALAPLSMLQRHVEIYELSELSELTEPVSARFIKPVTPKLFEAKVHHSLKTLLELTQGLPPDERIYVSEVVSFIAEARAFVLDAQEQNQLLSSSTPMPAISFGPWMIGMSSLRSAAGPTDSDAIVELVAAHLIELWVVHLCGAPVVPHVLDRAIRLFD